MERKWTRSPGASDDDWMDATLHPGSIYSHPSEVVDDPDLSLNEKRALLASWASDACAVEAAPALRRPRGAKAPVSFDEIMDALRALDRAAEAQRCTTRTVRRRERTFGHDRGGGTTGPLQ